MFQILIVSTERFYSGTCVCRGGWTGDMCGSSRDPCDPSPCFGDVTCTAAPDKDNGYQCGLCPSGMLGDDGIKCYGKFPRAFQKQGWNE